MYTKLFLQLLSTLVSNPITFHFFPACESVKIHIQSIGSNQVKPLNLAMDHPPPCPSW